MILMDCSGVSLDRCGLHVGRISYTELYSRSLLLGAPFAYPAGRATIQNNHGRRLECLAWNQVSTLIASQYLGISGAEHHCSQTHLSGAPSPDPTGHTTLSTILAIGSRYYYRYR